MSRMLRGLTTISYFADDVAAAAQWYRDVLGFEPYFSRDVNGAPAYVEFRIGDREHELGIIDRRFAPNPSGDGPGGAIVYWHVDDVRAALDRLLELGARPYEEMVERGPGFVTASVVDPFGNILSVMYNQHFVDMVSQRVGLRETET
jgi:predicted enzyme related to lactoylglutathione lyase